MMRDRLLDLRQRTGTVEGVSAASFERNPVFLAGCGRGPFSGCEGNQLPAAPVTNPSDDRFALAKAYEWAWRIIVVSLEMVLPGVAGYWVDIRLGTVCLFLVIGLIAGSFTGMRHLLRMTQQGSSEDKIDR